jgi:hypothetical protein
MEKRWIGMMKPHKISSFSRLREQWASVQILFRKVSHNLFSSYDRYIIPESLHTEWRVVKRC